MMVRSLGVLLGLFLVLTGAEAQAPAPPVSTIEAPGVATVDAPPDYVDFWLHKKVAGTTFVEVLKAAQELAPNVRKELAALELSPADVVVSSPAVPDVTTPEARISARARFNMVTFSNREKGLELFATVCDKMIALAKTLGCVLEGPILGVQSPSAVEQAAVGLATENALPVAQASAQLMNAQIVAVDKLVVVECAWNKDPETRAALPDIRRVTCTARVKVTYAFSAVPR